MKEGLSTYLRLGRDMDLIWGGVYPNLTYSVSHRRYWNYLASDYGLVGQQAINDECCVRRPTLLFTFDTSSFVDMENCQAPLNCNVYTDGSKLRGRVGAGLLIQKSVSDPISASF